MFVSSLWWRVSCLAWTAAWARRLICLPRRPLCLCLPSSPLAWAGPGFSQWRWFMSALFRGFSWACRVFRWLRDACCDAVLGCAFRWLWWRCLLRRLLFGVFELRWLPQPALPLSWIAATEGALALAVREVWPRDAVTGWAWGEHSAPDVVRDGAVHAVSELQPGDWESLWGLCARAAVHDGGGSGYGRVWHFDGGAEDVFGLGHWGQAGLRNPRASEKRFRSCFVVKNSLPSRAPLPISFWVVLI